MADQSTSGGSPWEEVLDEPESPTPKIFGTLEHSGNQLPVSGSQLKVPDNIPDGVGSKVPGETVAQNQPQNTQPNITQPQPPTVPPPSVAPVATKPTPLPAPVATKPAPPPPVAPKTNKIIGLFKRPATTPPRPNQQKTPLVPAPPAPTPSMVPARPVSVPPQKQITPPSKPAVSPLAPPISTKPLAHSPATPKAFPLSPKIMIAAIVIVLLVGLTYLNETGILATGLEKIYGIFRVESLWGGLPADSQLALVQSFGKMKNQPSLKLDSEIKFTVNRSSNSNVTKPLLSLSNQVFIFALDKAVLASTTSLDQLDQGAQTPDAATTTPSVNSATDTTSTTPDQSGQGSSSTSTPQTTQSGTDSLDNVSTIKEFSSTSKAYLSDKGASAQIELGGESGKKSNLNLYQQNGRLYVSSTGVDYSGSSTGWVFYPISSGSQESLPAIFNQTNLSGFSVTGKRIGSGKVNGVAVYRYQVNIKIGSLLSNIGVQDEMVNSITGEIDISKKDQLIKYLELTITPSISSAITRIDLKTLVSDYGLEESLTIPEKATEVKATGSTTAGTTAVTAVLPLTTAGVSTELLARDAQRKTDLKNIEQALESYHVASGNYPSSSGLEIQTRTAGNALQTALVPTYLASLPVDPMTDKYYYGYESDGSTYTLSALLGNNQDLSGVLTSGKNFYTIKH